MDDEMIDPILIKSGPDQQGICRVMFNRPQKANALNAELAHAFLQAIQAVPESDCNAVIIQGAGRNFCAGFDFEDYDILSPGDIIDRFVAIDKSLQLLRRAPFVSIAIVQGAAFGAGADIVASSTYRLGSDRARFRFPGFQFGVALGTRHLAQLIGMQKARQILLENSVVGCDEALAIGLLTHREQDGALLEKAEMLASVTASLGAFSIERILRLTSLFDPDRDMADLIESLSRPGLHERIARYRNASSAPN
jgi:enoyl-CoA hydratase/carnithine racemase